MNEDEVEENPSRYTSSEAVSEPDPEDPWGMKYTISLHTSLMGQYLDGEIVHPVWRPVQSVDNIRAWEPSDHSRLTALGLFQSPSYGNPDMLLYRLGRLDSLDPSFLDRMDSILTGNDHVYLSNASGTGKTRMCFEILSRHWGLYLTCRADRTTDPYGSVDVSKAISDMRGSRFTPEIPLSTRLSRQWRDALEENRRIARVCFSRLILARMLILNEFRKLVAERGMPEGEAMLKWLMIQLRPTDLLGDDVFKNVLLWLQDQSDDDVTRIYATLPPELLPLISYIAIDEAQVALNLHRSAFATGDNHRHAPILRELVVCLGDTFSTSRVLFSGVQLDLDVVSDALRASTFARKSVRHYHSFGYFASLQQCSTYIRHFLGDEISGEHCELAFRWLHGRYRVIAVLVMLTLRFGPRNLVRVMDNLLYRLTGYQRPGFCELHSNLISTFNLIIQAEKAEDSQAAFILRKSVLTYVVHRLPTVTDSHSRDLVHLAVALYTRSAEEAIIFEPFILVALAHWLALSPKYGIQGVIRRRLADNAARPLHTVAFIEGLAPCLMEAFRSAPTLEATLLFPGRKPPWTRHAARLVLPRFGQRNYRPTSIPSDGVAAIQCAATSTDVFAWLRHATAPFLIPDPGLGADLLFMLEIDGPRTMLVCVHADPFNSTRPRRHIRVVPPSPEYFYKNDTGVQEQLFTALKMLPQVPLDVSRTHSNRLKTRYAKFSTLHLLCFEQPFRDEAYDPPVAKIRFDYLLRLPRPQEFTFASIHESIASVSKL